MRDKMGDDIDPWNADATHWKDSDFDRLKAFGDYEVLGFCQDDKRSAEDWITSISKCVLVGQRGLGKSFLLAYRSHHHRNADKVATYIHPHGGHPKKLVERLTSLSGAIPEKHWLRSSNAADAWGAIWQVAILGLLVWRLCDDRSSLRGFKETFAGIQKLETAYAGLTDGQTETDSAHTGPPLQWFFGQVIESQSSNRASMQQSLSLLLHIASSEWAVSIKHELNQRQRRRIALYIDNPDELVETSMVDVWVNVQQGLLLAIWKLRKGGVLTEELNIFASIRSEAVFQRQHRDLKTALDLAIHLRYDHQTLENLFESRITLTDVGALKAPELLSSDPVTSFLGFPSYVHHDRRKPDGLPVEERAISAIIRHTRLVPRELVVIGKAISSIRAALRTTEEVKNAVNTESKNIVDYIKVNCIPPWNSALDRILCSISSPVIKGDDLRSLAKQHNPSSDGMGHLRVLLSLGLIGHAEPDTRKHRHFYTQRFAFDPTSEFGHPHADFFFTHPATKEWIRSHSGSDGNWERDASLLIGNGLPYESQPPVVRLMISANQPTVVIDGKTLQSNSGTSTDPIRFLFLALAAWKARGGVVWPTMNDLRAISAQLHIKFNDAKFPKIKSEQGHQGSQIRNWSRRLNENPAVKALKASLDAASTNTPPDRPGRGKKLIADMRRTGFISVSAHSDQSVDASIGFIDVDPLDIHIHDDISVTLK